MQKKLQKLTILTILLLFLFTYSQQVFAQTAKPEVTSESAILVDNYTGTVIYEKNIDEKMYPASTTKILTAILAIENCSLTDTATASYDAIMSVPNGYSVGAIQVGEKLSIENLLEVLLVHSANDAANVLGEHVGGSIDSFASIMNTKALEIGCKNSHFVNPSGKHDDNHYTTARDLALIMQYCMKNDTFRRISSMRSCTLPATDKSAERTFKTTVEILIPDSRDVPYNYYYPYAIAGKTGFTTEAKNCLVSVSKKDDLELTSVILGSDKTPEGYSARFLETKAIYNYGFDNYAIKQLAHTGDIVDKIDVPLATPETKELNLSLAEDILVFCKKDEDLSKITPEISLYDNIKAPLAEGSELGTITYTVEGVTYSTKLLSANRVEKSPIITYAILICSIIVIIFIIILVIILTKTKKDKPQSRKRKLKKARHN